jgi:hypothetical protein
MNNSYSYSLIIPKCDHIILKLLEERQIIILCASKKFATYKCYLSISSI